MPFILFWFFPLFHRKLRKCRCGKGYAKQILLGWPFLFQFSITLNAVFTFFQNLEHLIFKGTYSLPVAIAILQVISYVFRY